MTDRVLNDILMGVFFLVVGLVFPTSHKRMAQRLYEFYEIRRALGLTRRVYDVSCFVSAIVACTVGLTFIIIGIFGR